MDSLPNWSYCKDCANFGFVNQGIAVLQNDAGDFKHNIKSDEINHDTRYVHVVGHITLDNWIVDGVTKITFS